MRDDEDLQLAREAIDGSATALLRVIDRRIARAVAQLTSEQLAGAAELRDFAAALRASPPPAEDPVTMVRRMVEIATLLTQASAPADESAHRPCARCGHRWGFHDPITRDDNGNVQGVCRHGECGSPTGCGLYLDPEREERERHAQMVGAVPYRPDPGAVPVPPGALRDANGRVWIPIPSSCQDPWHEARAAHPGITSACPRCRAQPALGRVPWESAGGPNECEHGYAAGIMCPACRENDRS